MRIGLIGLGMASAPHAQSLIDLKDRVQVAGAYSPTRARREAFHEKWDLPVTDDLDGLFADPSVDAVVILTPPNSHRDLVKRAAEAKKHVLLEKPLEVSMERSVSLVELAEAGNIKLGVVLQHRFRPISVALARLVAEGRLGEIVGASAKLFNWRPQSYYDQPGRGTRERDGGGVLLTQGIHTLDLLISVAGLPVEAMAYATTTPVHRMETEDLVAGAVRFSNGALGTVSATTCGYPGLPDAIEIIGTKGTARIDGAKLTANLHDSSTVELDDGQLGGGAGADPMAFSHAHHRAVLEDFADAVERDREPRISGREALKVHRLIDAMLRSSLSGRPESV